MTCAASLVFGRLQVNERSEVRSLAGRSIPGLYAAGELVGGLFYENYPGGSGLMGGSVFGRRAGGFAAEHARQSNAAPRPVAPDPRAGPD